MSGIANNVDVYVPTALGNLERHNPFNGMWRAPEPKKPEMGTLPMITHKGGWCVFDANIFCQQSRCSDCAICEDHQ